MAVEQMESADYRVNWPGASGKDVLQSTVGAAREQETVNIQGKFMMEVVRYVFPICILKE